MVDNTVFLVGGHSGETPLKLFESFEPGEELEDRGNWRRLDPMLARRTYCSSLALDGMVYVIGGSADGRALNSFEVYDAVHSCEWARWFTKPPMQIKRTLHAAAVCSDRIFVVGGFDGLRDLNLMEEYDPKTNSWRWGSAMERRRSYFALCACAGSMYAIGGQDRGSETGPRAHRHVERFDLYSEMWFEAAPLLEGRVGCAAASLVCDDGLEYIFVCGGSDGDASLSSMERYDPRQNVWTEAPPMSEKRLGHTVAVVRNRLYAIGGFDGMEALGTFECFDPKLSRWGPLLDMGAIHNPPAEDGTSSSATGTT